MGLSVGLDTAIKALRAHQLAVDVASHNIANAQSPGFSRQRVLLRPMGLDGSDHFTRDALLGRAGFGVDARDVNRVRDVFLDYQLRTNLGARDQNKALSQAIGQSELVFNDPTDSGLSTMMANFWASWHDVVNDPESPAARTTLVHSTTTLTTRIQRAAGELESQRTDINRNVVMVAERINARADEIASLNFQIKQVELNGDMANDLRDRRDLLLDELSGLGDISYSEQPDSSIVVYLGSHELVFSNMAREVSAVADTGNPGMDKLIFTMDNQDVASSAGELRGLLDARDVAIPDLLSKLDALASTLITSVNAIHVTGVGLDNTTGLAFFTGTGASDIALNAVLAANPHQIGAGTALNAPGDGSKALAIANLQLAATMAAGTQTFDEFYGNVVSVLGADVDRAAGLTESGDLMTSHLDQLRQSVSGVNLDEEMTNLTASQHAYEAAARVITTIDEMLDTLINRTGAVGR